MHAPADELTDKIASAEGTVTPIDDHTSRAVLGGQTVVGVAATLTRLDGDFTIERSDELAQCLSEVADRYRHAIGAF
ncbi:hypothetical protein [Gordonia sp. DT101]|uniref:hypothetical protein n=1 Tax=Gordonia sp. DT101 TaxID=3416545 RepID=UPI003CF5A23B